MPTQPKRILADRIAPMKWSLINEAIVQCHNVEVVANDVASSALSDAIRELHPDILILGNAKSEPQLDFVDDWLLSHRPPKRVLTLFGAYVEVQLAEWRVVHETLGDLSLSALRDVIEGRR